MMRFLQSGFFILEEKHFMVGKTISNYKYLEKLGKGSMGEVYLVHDTDLDRKVALKFLPLPYTKNKEINKRFKREVKAVAKLNLPNIIIDDS